MKGFKRNYNKKRGEGENSRSWYVQAPCCIGVGRVPGGAKDVDGLGEEIIVDDASVDGEQAHQEDDVATIKHSTKHLKWEEEDRHEN